MDREERVMTAVRYPKQIIEFCRQEAKANRRTLSAELILRIERDIAREAKSRRRAS